MATRFVELNEASQLLGITPERLVEMRSNGEIHGYRDGASWKFKIEEVERVKAELAGGGGSDMLIPFDDGLDELSLEGDEPQAAATSPSSAPAVPDSDLKLSGDSDLRLSSEESDLALSADSDLPVKDDAEISLDIPAKSGAVDSDVALVPGVGSKSDVELVADTGSDRTLKAKPAVGADVLGDSGISLNAGSGTGALPGSSGGTSRSLGSSDLDIALDSELALSDDDDMVLGGSGTGTDLSLHAGDSGINLGSPTDSGLSLEADSGINLQTPTDSGLSLEGEEGAGSSISALELPEDESIELESDAFEGVKKDEEFLLSPSDEMFTDESDSGSQVIALEDSVAFNPEDMGGTGALLSESAGLDQQLDALEGGGVAATPITAPTLGVGPAGPPEAPYSVLNIIGLLSILFLLSISGLFLTDIMSNMWAWEDGIDVSSSIAEGITDALYSK